jgi:hypothetical protein
VALREYTETPIRQGWQDNPWERVVKGAVLGSKEYAARVMRPADAQVAEGEMDAW